MSVFLIAVLCFWVGGLLNLVIFAVLRATHDRDHSRKEGDAVVD
jgi:hypothetical protein